VSVSQWSPLAYRGAFPPPFFLLLSDGANRRAFNSELLRSPTDIFQEVRCPVGLRVATPVSAALSECSFFPLTPRSEFFCRLHYPFPFYAGLTPVDGRPPGRRRPYYWPSSPFPLSWDQRQCVFFLMAMSRPPQHQGVDLCPRTLLIPLYENSRESLFLVSFLLLFFFC